jgi:hypothetical protein
MSLALLNSIVFRILTASPYVTKGSSLTWTEEDTNFKIIGDAIKQVADANVTNFTAYNSGTTYSVTTPATYVSYSSSIYKAVGTSTGVIPGTDITKWLLVSNGEFTHVKDNDTKLAAGTANEVTATQLRAIVDSFRKDNFGAASPPTNTNDNTQGYKPFSFWWTTSKSLFMNTSNATGTATWILIFGSGD